MRDESKEKLKKNIKSILMFKAIDKIHDIVEKEKKQKKSDKMHIVIIIVAFVVAMLITVGLFSVIQI